VRDEWIIPAAVAMTALTIVGIVYPSDYVEALLFFMPQLAIAAFVARRRTFA
jgi:hypothetical protein